jgi:hypothetical protein
MHTSKVLKSTDFHFIRYTAGRWEPQTINDFIPAYHEKDRIGVVSPYIEDGLACSSTAVLALCTLFYDRLRDKEEAFFDYPQHFAFIDINADGVNTQTGRRPCRLQQLGAGWGHLDVWPESQWIASGHRAGDFLRRVYEFHIDCLFWPEGFIPQKDNPAEKLPSYARRLLNQRLKAVYLYRPEEGDFEIKCTPTAKKIINQSQINLAETLSLNTQPMDKISRYRLIDPAMFLAQMEDCFQLESS